MEAVKKHRKGMKEELEKMLENADLQTAEVCFFFFRLFL